MNHNDKRSHSVPAGTFTDHKQALSSSLGATKPPPIPDRALRVSDLAPADAGDAGEVHEDTLPGFTLEPGRVVPRQRVRTLVGVPAVEDELGSGDSAAVSGTRPAVTATPLTAAELTSVPLVSSERTPAAVDISSAIAEVLEVLDEHAVAPQKAQQPTPELPSEPISIAAAPEASEPSKPDAADDDSSRLSSFPSVTVPESARFSDPPRAGDLSLTEAPSVIDVAPPRRPALPEPARALSSLDDLGADMSVGQGRAERSQPIIVPLVQTPTPAPSSEENDARAQAVAPLSPPLASPLKPNVSSLAPREVARSRVETAPRKSDRSSVFGALAVAALVLLAAGAWWLTSGTFQRSSDVAMPAAKPGPMAVAAPPATLEEPEGMAKPKPAPDLLAVAEPTPQPAQPAQPVQPVIEATPTRADDESEKVAPNKPQKADKTKEPRKATARKPAVTSNRRPGREPSVKPSLPPTVVAPEPTPMNPPPQDADMPEAPSRTMVLDRMESVRSSVQACAAGRSGVADLDVTIAHTGAVIHVLVGGDFAGTTEGSCIARAVRAARFPSFKQERFRLLFPYAI